MSALLLRLAILALACVLANQYGLLQLPLGVEYMLIMCPALWLAVEGLAWLHGPPQEQAQPLAILALPRVRWSAYRGLCLWGISVGLCLFRTMALLHLSVAAALFWLPIMLVVTLHYLGTVGLSTLVTFESQVRLFLCCCAVVALPVGYVSFMANTMSYAAFSDLRSGLYAVVDVLLVAWMLAGVCGRILYRFRDHFLDVWGRRPRYSVDGLKSSHAQVSLPKGGASPGHSHPEQSRQRNSVVYWAERVAFENGMGMFLWGISKSQARHGHAGNHRFSNAKSTEVGLRAELPDAGDLVVTIDKDYYEDMPELLTRIVQPWLVVGFTPCDAACSEGEVKYRFLEDSFVEFVVDGAACYKHRLWHYGSDFLVVSRTGPSAFWSPRTVVYKAEHRLLYENHSAVLLCPVVVYDGLAALFAETLEGSRLERLDVVEGDFVRFDSRRGGKWLRTTGHVGGTSCATTTVAIDDEIRATVAVSNSALSVAYVQGLVPDICKGKAAILVEYHRRAGRSAPPLIVTTERARVYDFSRPELADHEAQPLMTPFMSPIVHEGYTCVNAKSSIVRCVVTRIQDVRAEPRPATNREAMFIHEFVEMFLGPMAGKCVPYPVDEIDVRMNRPTQRRITEDANFVRRQYTIVPFLKKEAYGKPQDPRNISPVGGANKRDYSCYIYAFVEMFLEGRPWYCPGKKPVDIAKRIADICVKSKVVKEVDARRMDGSKGVKIKSMERCVLAKAFKAEFVAEVTELHASMMAQKAVADFGVEYETGSTELSGNPATTAMNTLGTFASFYCALREAGYSKEEAFALATDLSAIAGDDGTLGDGGRPLSDEHIASGYAMFDMTAEIISHTRESGTHLAFISRIYSPQVWFGCPDSCCDIVRQITKIHLSSRLPVGVTPLDKLVEKMRGFAFCDANTPVIREFLAVLRDGGVLADPMVGSTAYRSKLQSWWAVAFPDKESQWPNANEQLWQDAYFESVLPDFNWKTFREALAMASSYKSVSRLLTLPLCVDPKIPVVAQPLILDGVAHNADGKTKEMKDEKGLNVEVVEATAKTIEKVRRWEQRTKSKKDQRGQAPSGRTAGGGRGRGSPRGRGSA